MAVEFMTSLERRSTVRYRVKPDTFIYFYPPGTETATVQDFSLGGMYIQDNASLLVEGTAIDLELRVPKGAISLRGVVTRVDPKQGFAIRFIEYSGDLKDLLKERFEST